MEGRDHEDHESEQPDLQVGLGGRFLREPPVFPGVNGFEGDMEGLLDWSQIARAWNRVADVPANKRETRVLLLMIDEDINAHPIASRGNPRLLPDRDAFGDTARRCDEGVHQSIRSKGNYGRLEITTSYPRRPRPSFPSSTWTQPSGVDSSFDVVSTWSARLRTLEVSSPSKAP